MRLIRCVVCRQSLPTMKTLKSHYNAAHSKTQLVRALIKNTIYENNVLHKKRNPFEIVRPQYLKSEILNLEDGFLNYSDDQDDNWVAPLPKIEIKTETDVTGESLEESDDKRVLEDMKKRRAENLLKLRNFRFDKSLRHKKSSLSLNEQTGLFYVCRCSEDAKANPIVDCFQKNDLQNLISDTDSCSDTGKIFYMPKCYCDICGNGYKSKTKLIEHFEVHNTNCRICKKRFNSNFSYKQHMKRHLLKMFVCHLCGAEFGLKSMLMDHLDAHIEDDVFENVFSLEQDYKVGYFGCGNYFC